MLPINFTFVRISGLDGRGYFSPYLGGASMILKVAQELLGKFYGHIRSAGRY